MEDDSMLAWAVADNLSIGHLLRFRYGLEDPLSPFLKIIEYHRDLLAYSLRPEKRDVLGLKPNKMEKDRCTPVPSVLISILCFS